MADLKTTNIYGDAYINNKVGIATNAPVTRLQIGQLSPTAATEGIQFGDDTSTRIYRIGAGSLILSSSISTVGTITSTYGTFSAPGISIGDGQYGFYITSGNLTYKSAAGGAHYWRNIANSANTLTLDNSGNLTAAGTITAPSATVSGYITFPNDTNAAGLINTAGTAWLKLDDAYGNMYIVNNQSGAGIYFDSNAYYWRNSNGATTLLSLSGNGDLGAARYLSGTYVNTSDDVSTGTITYIMAKFGDNYYRSATAAKVAAFISGQTMNIAGSSTSCTGNAVTATTATALTSMNISQFTNNSGYLTSAVTSLAGTTNRITVSGATGAVTLNLPQDIHTGASPTFAGLSLTSVSTTGATITNLTGAYQNTTVYDSPRTQSATPSRGIRAPASSIQFTDSYAIAPFYTYRSTGDWPVPYGIGWGTGGESSGIFQRYASNGSSFGDMIFYTGNDGSGAFSFRRHTWEGTTYFAAGSGELNTELFRIDWSGNLTMLGTLNGSANSATLYANPSNYGSWKIGGTRNGWYGIEFESGTNLMANSTEVGFYRNGNGWQMRWYLGAGYIYKGSNGGGTEATILDSSNQAYAWNMNQNVRSTDSPTFGTLQLTRLNFGASAAAPYAAASGEGFGNGITFGGDENSAAYRIFTGMENIGGNYSKLTLNWHTGIRIGAYYGYGGIRFYDNFVGSGTKVFSIAESDSNVRVYNELFVQGSGIGAYGFMKYGGTRSGDWQLFTTSSAGAGQMNVVQVENIGGGGHTNYPTGVYTYGGVMSWRLPNHSFQLYAAHTGDLAYKTQWNNDNYSGWRRILDSSTYPYAANMNQYVRTTDTCSFAAVSATTFTGALTGTASGNLTAASSLTAGNLSGTIPSGVLGNSTLYIGTTAITLNRTSSSQTLTGTSIDGNAATVTNGAYLNAAQSFTAVCTFSVPSRTTSYTTPSLQVYTGDNTPPGIAFHRGGYSATYLYESDGELYTNPWTTRGQTGKLLAAGNYTDYTVTKTGTGASGTWGISITGNAATVTNGLYTNSSLTAGNLSGTIPSGVLGNSTVYIGTTAVTLNRTSSALSLTGVNIDGNAATATNVNISNLTTQQVSISLAAGAWYTIAANDANRASAKFTITDTSSGLHQAIHFYATAHYGTDSGAKISVISNTYYGGPPVSAIKIMRGSTYDGAMVQIYALSACSLTVSIYDNQQSSGWFIKSGVVSTTNPGTVANYAALTTVAAAVDLSAAKSFSVSDEIYIGGATTQYKALHANNYNSYSPTLTGTGASGNWAINVTGTAGSISGFGNPTTNSTANTIVYREGNGYITNNYFHTSGGGSERNVSGMTYFAGFNSSDYYIRSYTAAAVATLISGQTMNINGSSTSCSGNAATATTTDNINGRAFSNRDSGNGVGQDSYTNNGIGYVTGVSLFSQTDGGMYASAYSTSWIHQIYGDFRTGQLAIRGKNSGTWQSWRTVLDSTNASYAWNMNQNVRTTDTCSFAGLTVSNTINGSVTGNAGTATTLATGRAINGVSFNGSAAITVNGLNYNVNDTWLRENGDDAQFQMYGNTRTMIYRTDGNTNTHGGGGYAHIFYYGGSADANRMFIINTDGRLWSNYHGWLDAMNITGNAATAGTCTGNAATVTNGIYTTNYYAGLPLGKRRYRIHSADSTSLNSSITNAECGFTYGGSGEPIGPYIAFGGLGGSIDYSCQLVGAYSGGGNDFKIRTRNDDAASWNTWRTIVTDGNYTSYSPTLTGTGASGTWAISITGNAATVTNGLYTNSSLTAGNLSGTIPSGVLGNSTHYIGTTAITLNRTSSSQTLTGVSIDGNAATATSATSATYLNSSNYIARCGSSGNANTDFQNTPAGSVRHNGDDSNLTNSPGGTWWFYDNYRHSNNSNYWGIQVAWGWEDQANKLATRNITGGTFGGWVYYLNSGNYTSYSPALTGTGASGTWGISITGNAVTAGGLAVQTGTNYEVNKIVRTDGNGYVNFGWINTVSGDNGTTAIDRIYASSDAYIRYYTPANFRTVLDVPTRNGSGVTNFGINTAPSNRLHINGDGTNPAIRVDNGAVVLAASAASNSKTFYGWLPISIAGTTKWIQMYN